MLIDKEAAGSCGSKLTCGRGGRRLRLILTRAWRKIMYSKAAGDDKFAADNFPVKHFKTAGYTLRLATDELQEASKWAGLDTDRTSREEFKSAHRVESLSIQGQRWKKSEVQKALAGIERADRRLANRADERNATSIATTRSVGE